MIYVVSGYMRSGTSMMMQCLKSGGLKVAFDPDRDSRINAILPDGNDQFFEFEDMMRSKLFPHTEKSEGVVYGYDEEYLASTEYRDKFEIFDGQAIKILTIWLWMLPAKLAAEIIYMTRDPVEIRDSYYKFSEIDLGGKFVNSYWSFTDKIIANLKERYPVHVIHYNDFLLSPTFPDWPINKINAEKIITQDKYRSRHAA